MSRSGSRNANGQSSVALTTLKIAVVAPMPTVRISVAIAAKTGIRSQHAPSVADVVAQIVEEHGWHEVRPVVDDPGSMPAVRAEFERWDKAWQIQADQFEEREPWGCRERGRRARRRR
jgi:hypothetical protein